jgi:hypothetical protein
MYIYTLNKKDLEIFESLKTHIVDTSILEPIDTDCSGKNNAMYGKSQSEYQKEIQSELMKNKVVVKDQFGNISKVSKHDPRFLSGDLVGIAKGKIAVKDSQGNKYLIDKTDSRYISGELVGVAKGISYKQKVPSPLKGTFLVKDRDGNMCRVTKTDPRYLDGTLIHFNKKF